MWLYDDFVGNGLAAQYANAINNAVSSTGFTLSGPSNVFLNQGSTAQASDHDHAAKWLYGQGQSHCVQLAERRSGQFSGHGMTNADSMLKASAGRKNRLHSRSP